MEKIIETKLQVFLVIISIATIMLIITQIIMSEQTLKSMEVETKLKEVKTEYYQQILKGEERPWTTY